MKRHTGLLIFCLVCLSIGLGLQVTGISGTEWYVKGPTNTSNETISFGLWKRCDGKSVFKINSNKCVSKKVLKFHKTDFGKYL